MPSSNGPYHSTRNKLSNDPRESGTSPPQRAVQQYEVGQKVHLKIDPSVQKGRFHPRFDGQTGEVVGEQGSAYKVLVNDRGKDKTLIVTPAHMKAQQ